jgi:hypothetical protein
MEHRESLSCQSEVWTIVRYEVVRSQAIDSWKAKIEQGEFNEELSEWESRLPL